MNTDAAAGGTDSAPATANAAATETDATVVKANDAVVDANDAVVDANDAVVDANDAVVDANDAVVDAGGAVVDAEGAAVKANDAAVEADGAAVDGAAVDADDVAVGAGSGTRTGEKSDGDAEGERDGKDSEPADPFGAFAPEPEFVPGKVGRITRTGGSVAARLLVHEWTIVAIASVLLAVIMTWPAALHPATTIPQDIWDPTLQAWQMSWAGHILTTDPLQLWHANAFYPDQYSYAFSDTLLGYAPAGMIGSGPEAAIVRYNFVFIFIFAFAFFGAYALVRQLGAGRTGAAVAGAAFAYAPWRLGQAGHLHVLSIGGIALSLAMLARGHGFSLTKGYEPDKRRWGWVVGGWLVAAWQISLGFGIGMPFAYALLIIVLVTAILWLFRQIFRWGERRPFGWKLFFANLGGGLIFAAVSGMMAYPYLQVLQLHKEAKRDEGIISLFSPPLKGFFISPPESWLWGDAYASARSTLGWAPEMALLPGFFLYGLAFAGLFVSVWRLKHRIYLGLGVVLTTMLAMGSNGPGHGDYGYMALYRVLPGFEGIRTSGRLMVWVTLFLALLAAGAVSAFADRAVELFADQTQSDVGTRAGVWRLVTLIPLVLVLAEGMHKPGPNPEVPVSPVAMSTLQAPLMVLPTHELLDMNVMLWSTDGFPKMVNGGSGFTPDDQQIMRLNMQQFPDEATVGQLRELKIHTVVVLRDRAQGGEYAKSIDAPIDGLGISRTEQGNVILYKIDG
ncbi:hypothetical protein GCM10018962_11050 [Dactylosporangium matsuzakiense]|uniref:Uncharacterized protein n=1 Tax=Dactylosporangium matsuzakiense TaxID=53360 RepID=A0A9W6NJK2_9ACTN|nr:hypothetical protein GCM10017581_008530 [Dactylosporangium matsuzakiense]